MERVRKAGRVVLVGSALGAFGYMGGCGAMIAGIAPYSVDPRAAQGLANSGALIGQIEASEAGRSNNSQITNIGIQSQLNLEPRSYIEEFNGHKWLMLEEMENGHHTGIYDGVRIIE